MRLHLCSPLLLLACGKPPCLPGDGVAELGTGDEDFIPLRDGDDLPFVRGPQGGWHVLGSVRVTGLDVPEGFGGPTDALPVVSLELEDDGGAVVAGYQDLPRYFQAGPDGAAELVGELVQFFEDPAARVGGSARLRVAVCDRGSELAEDVREVVLRDGG